CDSDNARLTHCKQKWNIPSSYSDYRKLFKAEKPDIAVIATWTSTHKDIALNAVKNKVKGIVLEKPVASNFSLSRRVVDACRENNVKLVINHERRWDPLYRKAREIVENKSLGALKLIYGNVLSQSVPRGPWQSALDEFGGGPLLHDGTHLVDMVRYFGGDIAFVNGHVKREFPEAGAETTATALLRTTDGVDVFIE
ncbi:MAG: Gfo/Idh/MocA family oxidoreductase, partial [bacterium]|nr:Gfo/Idh/MocA family oxidoreductase [bacterium]